MKNSDDRRRERKAGKIAEIVCTGAVSVICLLPFASRLLFRSISIDTEMMINTPQRMLTSWLYHERPGLVISKYLFGQTSFHYTAEIAGTLAFLVLFAVLAAAFFGKEAEKSMEKNAGETGAETDNGNSAKAVWKNPFVWAFPLLFFTHPAVTEQLHFLLQSMEIAWALLLCLVSCVLTWTALWNRRPVYLPLAVLLMAWSFSSYQSLVAVYIAACAAAFLLYYEKYREKREKSIFWWRLAALHVLVFGKLIAQGEPEQVTALPEVIEAYLGRDDDDQD